MIAFLILWAVCPCVFEPEACIAWVITSLVIGFIVLILFTAVVSASNLVLALTTPVLISAIAVSKPANLLITKFVLANNVVPSVLSVSVPITVDKAVTLPFTDSIAVVFPSTAVVKPFTAVVTDSIAVLAVSSAVVICVLTSSTFPDIVDKVDWISDDLVKPI